MNCETAGRRLEAYLRDEIEGSELRDFISHISKCQACRAAAETAEPSKLFTRLSSRPEEDAGGWEGFWEGISSRLDKPQFRRRRGIFGTIEPFRGPALALAATVALVAALFFLVPGDPGTETDTVRSVDADSSMTSPDSVSGASEAIPGNGPAGMDDHFMETLYGDQIAEAIPTEIIRSNSVRELKLISVAERDAEAVTLYQLASNTEQNPVVDLEQAETMNQVLVYNLTVGDDTGGENEEIQVISFESDEFPF